MGKADRDKLAVAEAPGEGPIQRTLAESAREHGVWLIGGTLPLAVDGEARESAGAVDRVMNANLVYSPRGELAARYDKMHLFAYDNGRERYDESRTLRAGRTPVAFDAGGLRVGLSVCYDLRFPELYRALARPPCDLLSVPSAFTYTTGAAHWEVLLRARAVAAAIALSLALPAAAAADKGQPAPGSSSGSASCRGPAAMVDFGSDGRIGAKWNAATKTIAFGRPQPDGHYHAFIADAVGANERRVAFAAWRDDRHQFPAAWPPAR